ncbi:threonine/serine ThrE exporter family protein [Cellulomonas endometrii]|uniref:threonine/serine ThrE exporter family protein n=1 Tax=Cellulomonas endometrii TaxID=3036301 RepID=UPI0024ACF348|nr:threonine/serine exporter family protein [Cellulomonas endometrii]
MRRHGPAAALVTLLIGMTGVLGTLGAAAGTAPVGPGAAAVPAPSASPSPARPGATPTPAPSASPEQPVPTATAPAPVPAPSAEPSTTATTRPSPPSPSPTSVTPAPDDPVDDDPATTRRPPTAPALATSSTPWGQLLAALGVVVAGAVGVALLSARRARATAAVTVPAEARAADDGPPDAAPEDVLRLMVTAGEAMIDAGHTVSSAEDTLAQVAAAHGVRGAETVVLPTALIVSVPHAETVQTAVTGTGRRPLLLHQLDALADLLDEATTPDADPRGVTGRIALLRAVTPPFGTLARLGGYLLLSVGIAALLGASWVDLLVVAALGLAVGSAQLASPAVSTTVEVVLTVAASFAVSTVVLLLARAVPDLGVLPAIVAPLVLFLPGGLLTTGVIELATGQMLSGAGRVAAGTMQLVLLAGGIVAGAALVGVPVLDLTASGQPLGPLAPWAGVVLFGVGTVVFRCGRPRTIGWVVLVLAVAYGAQVVGDALLGGVLSAFVGALAMTPVALAVARFPSGPSPLVSFLPAFWMLVPGALGLVGVTSLLDGDSGGVPTLVTTAATMVAIALGVLVGLAGARALPGVGRDRTLV